MHIAMWSGPRNLSTAMMYSFASRYDFDVVDEPFYGAYLTKTGLQHPMRDQIIASMECDPAKVARSLTAPRARHLYSKQMTQHMIAGVPRDWFDKVRHVFLIRHPARVIASFAAKYEDIGLEDIGFRQQAEIYDQVVAKGMTPLVVDSFDIRADPERMLRKLCSALGMNWDPAMLSWPEGGHSSDGVWARHWYMAVHGSTGFAGPEDDLPRLEPDMETIAQAALPFYAKLAVNKLGL